MRTTTGQSRMRRPKTVRIWAFIFALCWPLAATADSDTSFTEECKFMADAGRPVHGILKRLTGPEVPIVVPTLYFGDAMSRPRDGRAGYDGAVLLYMHQSNPMPYPLSKTRGKLEAGIQDWLNVLLWDYISIEKSAETALSVYTQATRKGETVPTAADAYGLQRYVIPEELNTRGIDLFFAGDPSAKTDLIQCSRGLPSGSVNPQCQLTTEFRGIKTSIVFQRRYLSEWQSTKSNVALVLHCITKT